VAAAVSSIITRDRGRTDLSENTKSWYVYLIRTASGSLYTGITTDVERRFAEHQLERGKGAKSLRGKGPLELVFSAAFGNRSEASKIEHRIKQLKKSRKESLVRGEVKINQV